MHHLGRFKNECLAMHVYNLAALHHHDRFAYLNRWLGPSPGHPDPFTLKTYQRLQKLIPDLKIPTAPCPSQSNSSPKPPGIQLLLDLD
jgi:hypothetical protein